MSEHASTQSVLPNECVDHRYNKKPMAKLTKEGQQKKMALDESHKRKQEAEEKASHKKQKTESCKKQETGGCKNRGKLERGKIKNNDTGNDKKGTPHTNDCQHGDNNSDKLKHKRIVQEERPCVNPKTPHAHGQKQQQQTKLLLQATEAKLTTSTIVKKMGIPMAYWPARYREVIEQRKTLGYTADKYASISRTAMYVFLVHNGAPPALTLQWLHESGRVAADALKDLVQVAYKLAAGQLRSPFNEPFETQTVDLSNGDVYAETRRAVAVLPLQSRADIVNAEAYAQLHGTGRMTTASHGGDAMKFEDERRTYFEQHYDTTVARMLFLLNRKESPLQVREVGIGKTSPIFRARPILSVSQLRWALRKRNSSLHVGSAYDLITQEPCDRDGGGPLRTELCLEIDELPKELAGIPDALRWRWLRHALQGVVDVLQRVYGVKHMLLFSSGNKGPHCWLLDQFILQQSATERKAMFATLAHPTRQPWWDAQRSTDFYNNVLLASQADGGFGLVRRNRSADEIAALTWPAFDSGVALDKGHMHRMPFSVHESSMRIAIPFATVAEMPTCHEDAPLVTDPQLGAKLVAPISAMEGLLSRMQADDLLLPNASLATEFTPVTSASWSMRQATRKGQREVDTSVTLADMIIDVECMRELHDKLTAAVANPPTNPPELDADVCGVLSKAQAASGSDWVSRLAREAQRLNLLRANNVHKLSNVVELNQAGGRLTIYHPEINQRNFFKGLAASTRHCITNHQLLELDISAAHVICAWAAVVAQHGETEARRVCPNLHLVATDRATAVQTLIGEYHATNRPSVADAKTNILRSLNQSASDDNHPLRKPFLKKLVEERESMTTALLEFEPVRPTAAAIQEKAAASGKTTTLLSLLMQEAEKAVIVRAIADLHKVGWETVGEVNDAILLRHAKGSFATASDATNAANAARETMEGAGRAMGIPLVVKVDHLPRPLSDAA